MMTAMSNSTDDVNRSAASQGSTVPVRWKPSVQEPVPVVRCTATKRDGEQCGRWSLRGTNVCIKHGGQLPVVQEHAKAVVESARLRLMGLADLAIDQLEDLAKFATAEQVRLGASRDILDRAGIKGPVEIDITVKQEESPADRLRRQLEETRSRLLPHVEYDEDIIDATIEE